jgi:GT2 family glycosyltransferase/Tfp pilus assembly protein PilF
MGCEPLHCPAPFGAGQFFLYCQSADDIGMQCSIVIPCHNGAELTRACIESLLKQDLQPAEILIVDNASTDETKHLASLSPKVSVITQTKNRGFAGGVNAGIREACGDTILIVNNDTQAATNLLSEMHAVLRSDPAIGACSPVSNHVKGEAHILVGDFGRDAKQREEIARELTATATQLQDADTLAGLCLLIRRSTFDEIGLLDERFGHGNYEDDDLCLRLRMRGYRLAIARRAFLHHEGHATFRALGLDLKEQIAQRLEQFQQKWQHHAAGRALLASIHGDFALAADAASQAQRRTPKWLDADWHIGRHHETSGNAKTAINHLTAFLRHCPEHVGAHLSLALALLRDGQSNAGQQKLQYALGRYQPSIAQEAQLLQRLGQIEYDRGNFKQAAAHARTALEVAPNSGELHHWHGLCELAAENWPAAKAAFRAACDHGYALAHTNLGICQTRMGQHEAALESFEAALTLLPHDPVVRANYEASVAARAATPC